MLIAIPTGVKIFNWIATMWGGRIHLKTPMYFAIGFVAMFIIGGLSGVMHSSPPSDLQQTDTYFVVAHFHYVLFGGSIFALFSGFYYWFPKMSGKLMGEGLGKVHFWLTLLGFNLTFFPQHFLGMYGMPRRTFTYQEGLGFEAMNQMSTAGSLILGFSMLIFLWNLFRSLRKGSEAGNDPWNAPTLEWALPSPPPHYNYRHIPEVRHRDPLWCEGREEIRPEAPGPEPVMPSPSGWPIALAFALLLGAVGALVGNLIVVFAAVATLFASIYGWAFQPLER
jgi:cytochrome c oxidase subunit 1